MDRYVPIIDGASELERIEIPVEVSGDAMLRNYGMHGTHLRTIYSISTNVAVQFFGASQCRWLHRSECPHL
jgi:hypothetical protein